MQWKLPIMFILCFMIFGISAAEELQFKQTIQIEGTVWQTADGGVTLPLKDFPLVIALVKSPYTLNQPFDSDPAAMKYITTIHTDSNGYFSYWYTAEPTQNLYTADGFAKELGYLVVIPQVSELSGKERLEKFELIKATADPDILEKNSNQPGVVVFSLWDIWNKPPASSLTKARLEWVARVPSIYLSDNSLQSGSVIADTEPVAQEGLVSEKFAEEGPSIRFGWGAGDGEVELGVATEDFNFGYFSIVLRQDGTLWRYVNEVPPSGNRDFNIKCKTDSSSPLVTDLAQCKEWSGEKIITDTAIACDYQKIYGENPWARAAHFSSFVIDLNKIGKNDPALPGQYLGLKPLSPQDVTYLDFCGKKVDSSGIISGRALKHASAGEANRIFADLWLMGNCNRDAAIDYQDLSVMKSIQGKPALFDTICDMNGDRVIDQKDIDLLIIRLGNDAFKGDCNYDNRIDNADLGYLNNLVANRKEYSQWSSQCDMNGDNKIDDTDFNLLIEKLKATGTYGKQSLQGGNSSSPGSFIPEGKDSSLPEDKEAMVLMNQGSPAPQAQPYSIIEMIVSIPRTVMSIARLSPAATEDIQTSRQDPVVVMSAGSPDNRNEASIQVVDLSKGNAQSEEQQSDAGTSSSGKYFSGDLITVRDLQSEQEYRTDKGTSPQETMRSTVLVMDVPTTSISEPQVAPDRTLCPPWYTSCSGICTNVTGDVSNCGSCGNVCPGGVACINGQCVAQMVTTQPTRLGGVGTRGF